VTDVVVPDSSCLIALEQIGLLWLLPEVYPRVLVPAGVATEVRPTISEPRRWMTVVHVNAAEPPEEMTGVFGLGEREVIGLALTIRASAVVLDDRDARRWATGLGLPVVGTVGLLARARNAGHLSRLKPALDQLRASRFFLSERLYRAALVEAGEAAP